MKSQMFLWLPACKNNLFWSSRSTLMRSHLKRPFSSSRLVTVAHTIGSSVISRSSLMRGLIPSYYSCGGQVVQGSVLFLTLYFLHFSLFLCRHLSYSTGSPFTLRQCRLYARFCRAFLLASVIRSARQKNNILNIYMPRSFSVAVASDDDGQECEFVALSRIAGNTLFN